MSKKSIVIFSLIISMSMMVTVYAGNSFKIIKESKLDSLISVVFDFFERISLIPKENKITNLGLGDINVDGQIDKSDLSLLRKHVKSGVKLSEDGLNNADLNADMKIDEKDIDILMRYLAGEITMLPYTEENGELPIPLYPDPIKKETDEVIPKDEDAKDVKEDDKEEIKEDKKDNVIEDQKDENIKNEEKVEDKDTKEIIKDKVKIDDNVEKIEIIKPNPPVIELPVQPKPKLEIM